MSIIGANKNQANFLLRYVLQSFAIILFSAILIRTFLISSYVMSGWSMLPSVWPGDFLVAGKWGLDTVWRGDIVIVKCPNQRERVCLRRVVGVAGDRIEIQSGTLVVNGRPATYKVVSENLVTESVVGKAWSIWREPLKSLEPPPSTEALVIPPGHVYVLNDKRSDIEDSRSWGAIKDDLVEARALKVWLSLDWYEDGQVRSWPRVRWIRILRSID